MRIEGGVVRGETDPVKLRLGLVPQEVALHDELSARENLALFGAIYNMRGAELAHAMDAAFDVAGLSDRAKDRAGTFSGGMKRRLNLAAALLHGPRILLLDEPTVGVDPQSRNQIFSSLEELKRRENTGLHHALHGRGGAPLRPHHHHRSRQGDRQRHLAAVRLGAERERDRNRRGKSGPGRLAVRPARAGRRVRRRVGRQSLRVTVRDLLESSPRVLVWLRERGTHAAT